MQTLLQQIPKTDKLLKVAESLLENPNLIVLKKLTLDFLDSYRETLQNNGEVLSLEYCAQNVAKNYQNAIQKSLKPLINATGIIVHTNLGRSVFSPALLEEITPLLTHYNNLEYDVENGVRSERYIHLKGLLKTLLNVEDVLVVNNNAAAVFLILNTFAKQKEVIISRGELIEIGGSFRIPRVMEDSGAILREVGTTNKTHLKDYKEAINAESAMLFKAHKSNYAMSGFTQEVEFSDLVTLAKQTQLLDYYDLGSGYFGISQLNKTLGNLEPSLEEITKLNPSLISFSGDKLLGGTQAGIIIGKEKYIKALKNNQLLRMLRVDKFTIAALEATLNAYLNGEFHKIPSVAMLLKDTQTLQNLAQDLCARIPQIFNPQVITTKSYSGGGAMPSHYLESFGVAIYAKDLKTLKLDETKLERILRQNGIIARLENFALILDMRTLLEGDITRIAEIFTQLQGKLCAQI